MSQYIDKAAVMAEMEKRVKEAEIILRDFPSSAIFGLTQAYKNVLSFLDTLDVKESDKTAEAFARIIRANLTGIDKDVQCKFEQLYKEITGEKMYQGYND